MLFTAVCASADFEITEIMYDLDGADTNREWIEIKNTGNSTLDLSKWFFFSDNTKHVLVPQSQTNILEGGYAVIVQNVLQFKNDWSSYGGLIFDSSWTGFKNSGEAISLRDSDLNIVSPVNFSSAQGGAGDGYSLQKINGDWVGSKPTPGIENIFTKKVVSPVVSVSTKKLDDKQNQDEEKEKIEKVLIPDARNADEVINLNEIKTTDSKYKDFNYLYPYIGLIIIIGIGITAFLFIKKSENEEEGIEKKLTAKDIKIIE